MEDPRPNQSMFLVDTGADPCSHATPDFDRAVSHVERRCRGKPAVVWHRTGVGERTYRVAGVWQDDRWEFFGKHSCVVFEEPAQVDWHGYDIGGEG